MLCIYLPLPCCNLNFCTCQSIPGKRGALLGRKSFIPVTPVWFCHRLRFSFFPAKIARALRLLFVCRGCGPGRAEAAPAPAVLASATGASRPSGINELRTPLWRSNGRRSESWCCRRDGAQPKTLNLNPRSRFRSEFTAPASFLKNRSQAGEHQHKSLLNVPAQHMDTFVLVPPRRQLGWFPMEATEITVDI
nr:uncharacterized protein LOC110360151 isoform X2 [Columba livia]